MARRRAAEHRLAARRAHAAALAGACGVAATLTPIAAAAFPIVAPATNGWHAHSAAHTRQVHPRIQRPAHERVVGVTSSSFTVYVPTYARRFRLFASTNHHSVTVTALTSRAKTAGTGSKASFRSLLQRGKRVSLRNLPYSTAPYFYRVEAFSGTHHRWGAIHGPVGLLPATPTNITVMSDARGLSLSWSSGPATGYRITQATDAAMSQGVTSYTTSGPDRTFTPYGTNPGSTYYFTIQALNAGTRSRPSAPVTGVATTAGLDLRVMTYNVQEAATAGQIESGQPIPDWSQRRAGVVQLINEAAPDVISVQEAAAWIGDPANKVRQIDDLASALGGTYVLADTEVPPTQPHYFRTGVYILYNPTVYAAVGSGGHFDMGDTRWAAYQELKSLSTGTKFLFVAAHTIVGKGATYDTMRQNETASAMSQANAIAGPLGIPVIYAGDWNSDNDIHGHAFDGPRRVMQAAHYADSYDVAQSRTNAKYDSANNDMRTPPAFYERIDSIYVPQGVAVKDWTNELDLVDGKFVGPIPSDHNPVFADLVLPYPPSVIPSPSPTPTPTPSPTST
jgi:endonuclease/exonuclease/phosphatase family metal-dependent hydrolase